MGLIVDEEQISTPLLASLNQSNEEHKSWVKRRLKRVFGLLSKKKIAVWGLAYKPDTDTLRRSSSIELCKWLIEEKSDVYVYDPRVKNLPDGLSQSVTICETAFETLDNCDILVVATECTEFKDVAEQISRVK